MVCFLIAVPFVRLTQTGLLCRLLLNSVHVLLRLCCCHHAGSPNSKRFKWRWCTGCLMRPPWLWHFAACAPPSQACKTLSLDLRQSWQSTPLCWQELGRFTHLTSLVVEFGREVRQR